MSAGIPEVQAEQDHPVEIGDLVAEMCRRLGVSPADTAEICIEPGDLWIRTHDRNELGRKYVIGAPGPQRPDSGEELPPRYGELAETITRWKVRTTIPGDDQATRP